MRKLLAAALAIAVTASPAAALDRRVRINNHSSLTVVYLHGSNVGADTWEEDVLGSDVIGPHSRVVVNFNDRTGEGHLRRWPRLDALQRQRLHPHRLEPLRLRSFA